MLKNTGSMIKASFFTVQNVFPFQLILIKLLTSLSDFNDIK